MRFSRDVDPEVCKMQQRVAAYEYARQAAEKPFPGGVRPLQTPHWPARRQLASLLWRLRPRGSQLLSLRCNMAAFFAWVSRTGY